LKEKGYVVIDADQLAREVVEPGTAGYKKIVEVFGTEVLLAPKIPLDSGDTEQALPINRQKLGQIVFANEEKRKILNSITHPAIRRLILWRIITAWLSMNRFVILDAPLLFESGLGPFMTSNVVIYCSPAEQIRRLRKREPQLSELEAKQRISSQMPLDQKCRKANFVINNNGTVFDTFREVDEVLAALKWQYIPFFFLRYALLGVASFIAFYHFHK
jgi:dephospho-CoA kinase